MTELVLLLSADLDVQEAFAYYEEYQEGRGAVFVHHLGQLSSNSAFSRGAGCASIATIAGYLFRTFPTVCSTPSRLAA